MALQELDLSIEKGEVFGFLGPNGAGKSTTINILTGQLRATSGAARIFGISVASPSARTNIGYLPENPAFYHFMTAREYLRFVGRTFRMSPQEIDRETERVLTLLDLTAAADRPIKGFSKGMTQRLGLAQALVHGPDLYILDEPMSGLDPIGRALAKDIIVSLKKEGKTVFFSTHITADVEAVCDRVGIIVKGQLRALDEVENIMRGTESYLLEIRSPHGDLERKIVGKEQLSTIILQAIRQESTIERIEPKRKSLEKFFLETVNNSDATSGPAL
ncbi:MAG: ABC transporter ATP-binding protein [Desulfobacteraceae bacterium]|nr:ABC transporter ATP-binding protein [Desulfobacteraceae bacterium]